MGEAGCTPAAHSLISDLAPPEKRASAISFYSLGIPIGSLLGMLIGGQLADAYGWRVAFYVVGAPGILLALLVWIVLKEPRKGGDVTQTPVPAISAGEALSDIFASRAFIYLMIAGAGAAFLGYGKVTWTTIFLQRTHGLTPGEVGFWFGILVGAAGVLGTWLGGYIADRFGQVKKRHILTGPAIGYALGIPFALCAYWVDDWRMALVLLLFPTVLGGLYIGPLYSCGQGLVRPQARAMASAVLLFAQNLIGLGLGPSLFGMVSDMLRPTAGPESVRWVLYGAALIGVIPAFFFWRASLRLDAELDVKTSSSAPAPASRRPAHLTSADTSGP